MTIARRRGPIAQAVAAPMPTKPARPGPAGGVPLPVGDAPAPDAVTPAGRLRRCTFRRIDAIEPLPGRTRLPTYEVMCLYGDGEDPLALGDIADARPICDACPAEGIFRPDED